MPDRFSYSCHASVFPVFHEMKTKTTDVFLKVTIANHAIVLVFYVVSGYVFLAYVYCN